MMFRGAYTPRECGEDPGQGCVRGVRWSPERVGGRVCSSGTGLEAGDPGAASFSPLAFTPLRGRGPCTGEFRGLVKHQCA